VTIIIAIAQQQQQQQLVHVPACLVGSLSLTHANNSLTAARLFADVHRSAELFTSISLQTVRADHTRRF
jgi:hypothetical protein